MAATTIPFGDFETQRSILERQLQFNPTALPSALRACAKRIAKHYGLNSKYLPHQGEKEKARRVYQASRATPL